MDRKIRGVIDPYTLGFLLGILGVFTAHAVHNKEQSPEETVSAISPAAQQRTGNPHHKTPEAIGTEVKIDTATVADK